MRVLTFSQGVAVLANVYRDEDYWSNNSSAEWQKAQGLSC